MTKEQWSVHEQWAWEEIRAGRIADFNKREQREPLDPSKPEGWSDLRRLGSDFVKEILFREPCRSDIPDEGVRVVGALFQDGVDIEDGHLECKLRLERCRFEKSAKLMHLHIEGRLSFENSAFCQRDDDLVAINLNDAVIRGSLLMGGATFQVVVLAGAKVDGLLDLTGTTVAGTLHMNSLQVGQDLRMGGATFQAVVLINAKVDGCLYLGGTAASTTVARALNMNSLQVGQDLLMGGATFQEVVLTNAKVDGCLYLGGTTVAVTTDARTTVAGTLNMNSLQVGQDLLMGAGATFQAVDLAGAKVNGLLDLAGTTDVRTTVAGTLNMNSLQVGQDLLMGGATFQEVVLTNAKVDRCLYLDGTTVAGTLNMNHLQVGQDLLMTDEATFQEVVLAGAKVDGRLYLGGATVAGTLNMNHLQVGQDLRMGGATFDKPVSLIFARIGANLDLTAAAFTDLSLQASRIEGELLLDAHLPSERPACLNLRNTHAGALQVELNAKTNGWPGKLELDGFTYDRLGGFAADGDDALSRSMLGRDIRWYTNSEDGWLARDPSYSPQPYVQLAAAFRTAGELEKADLVLYASHERARRVYAGRERAHPKARSWRRWLWLSALKWTIGYGIGLRYFYALPWVLVLTALGTAVVAYGQWQDLATNNRSGEAQVAAQPAKTTAGQSSEAVPDGSPSNRMRADKVWPAEAADWSDRLPRDVFYSLDELLPIVTLDPAHDKVELGGCVRYYFMLHRLLGFLLGGFILAGLAGLTQKP